MLKIKESYKVLGIIPQRQITIDELVEKVE